MAGIIFITYGAVLHGFEMNRRGGVVRDGRMPAPPVIGYFDPANCPKLVEALNRAVPVPDVDKRFADSMAYCMGGGIPA